MEDAYTPSNIFDNRQFDTCYAWNKQEILQFLNDVAADPQKFGVDNADVQQDLIVLKDKIIGLTDFEDLESLYNVPQPPQQALRIKTGGSQTKPKIALAPTTEIHWSANNNKEKFYLIYDLLGAILSPITTITTQLEPVQIAKNYFLPLVVLYAKWCIVLAAPVVRLDRPTMVQVTWFKKDQKLYPFFGASLAGYNNSILAFVKEVQETRYNYLNVPDMLPQDYATDYNDSPSRGIGNGDGKAGSRFGNCAETYPYLYILRDQVDLIKQSYGIATELGPLFRVQDNRFDVYNGRTCWEAPPAGARPSLRAPCINCQALLGERQVPLVNYTLFE